MNLNVLAHLTWYELVLAIIVLLALWMFFRFMRPLSQKKENTQGSAEYESDWMLGSDAVSSSNKSAVNSPTKTAGSALNGLAVSHDGSRELKALRQELDRMSKEIEKLKIEVRTLREERHQEDAHDARESATQNVSPYYTDAMQMAMRGEDASSISRLCGISRAEADLVVSMAKSGKKVLF